MRFRSHISILFHLSRAMGNNNSNTNNNNPCRNRRRIWVHPTTGYHDMIISVMHQSTATLPRRRMTTLAMIVVQYLTLTLNWAQQEEGTLYSD
jgi:hypothetical protein